MHLRGLKLFCPFRCLLNTLLLYVSHLPMHSQSKSYQEEEVNQCHAVKETVTITMQITAA